MKKISKLLALAIILLAMSCTSDIQGPLVDNGAVPQSIKINKVENLPGGSRVFYMLPDDPNVLYIRCEYTLPNGETKVVKGSTYSNFIELEGFGRSHEQEVKLYTVSRSEKSSEPVSVKIHPEPARIHEVFETLQVAETFGGVITSFTNASKSELVMYTLIKDEEGNWLTYDRLYTNALERNYSIRGLESESTEFGFYFTDKWNNNSDTLMRTMVPLYEKLIEKDAWKNAKLFNDTYTPQFAGAWDLENIWDGTSSAVNGFYHGHPSEPADLTIPNWFTIDLGNSYVFSRIRVNQMNHHPSFMYSAGAPEKFEIWASNNPTQDGAWDSWVKLGDYESKKPSGSPMGVLTDEDMRVAVAGEDFDFPLSSTAYRYIRFKTNRTYGGTLYVAIAELTLWGQQVN